MGKFFPTPAVVHACYRDSRIGSAVVGTMQTVHRIRGTWRDRVDHYIALTDFARNKFIEGGLPANKITVKPNFVSVDPGCGEGGGDYALFVGRLSPEKGLETLLAAGEKLGDRIGLKIIGDGPLAPTVEQAATRIPGVQSMGRQSQNQLQTLMKNAQVLIFPSLWYETFGLVVIEAYAAGVPVIASNLGTMSLLIDPDSTGLLFRAGDPQDLQERIEWILSHPQEVKKMRQEARREFESKYTATQNYQQLMEIYETVRS